MKLFAVLLIIATMSSIFDVDWDPEYTPGDFDPYFCWPVGQGISPEILKNLKKLFENACEWLHF